MIDVYVCEDNSKELNFLKQKIEDFILIEDLDMQIAAASSDPMVILKKAREAQNCGLYFLDIDLQHPQLNGFHLALNIRKIEPRCFIVFVTSHIELSVYTYQYKLEAMDFIIKDDTEMVKTKVHECLLNAYEKHTRITQLNIPVFTAAMPNERQISIPYNEIICFEPSSSPHKVSLHGCHRVTEFPEQLCNLEEQLSHQFLRCHRSVIINLMNVKEVDYKNNEVTMCDGSIYPLSMRQKGVLKKRLKNYGVL